MALAVLCTVLQNTHFPFLVLFFIAAAIRFENRVQRNIGVRSAPKKTRSVPSAGKFMASVFWHAERILSIDYLEKVKTITGEYYSNLLTRLDEKIREKRSVLQKKKKIIFYQDNTRAHKSVLAMGKLRDLHYELLEHPPHSQIWLPLTSISSQNSNSSSLVSVFLRIKRRLQL